MWNELLEHKVHGQRQINLDNERADKHAMTNFEVIGKQENKALVRCSQPKWIHQKEGARELWEIPKADSRNTEVLGSQASVVPSVIGALDVDTHKLEEWCQQIPGTTTENSVQRCAISGTAKILNKTLKVPGLR